MKRVNAKSVGVAFHLLSGSSDAFIIESPEEVRHDDVTTARGLWNAIKKY